MELLTPELERRDVLARNSLALAHVGDSVYELMVRTRLCAEEVYSNARQHRLALQYVSAEGQTEVMERILPHLTEEEHDYFLRGRNAHTGTVPKHAGPAVYHTATGLETLFGTLWLLGRRERLEELFAIGCPAAEAAKEV